MASEIEVFILVVDSGSFSAAARELGVLPSTISRQISRLEDRIGVRLLHRSTRSVTMTQVGAVFYEGGRRIVDATSRLEAMVQDTEGDLRGTIRVGAPVTQDESVIAGMLGSFLREHPHSRATIVALKELSSNVSRRVDVILWVGELADHDWTARQVGETASYLVATPEYLTNFGWPRDLTDLEEHHCIMCQRQNEWPVADGSVLRPDPRVVAPNQGYLAEFVRAGTGIGMMYAQSIREDIVSGRLVRVLPDLVENSVPIWVLYPRDRLFPHTARAFVEHAATYFDDDTPDLAEETA